MFFLSIAHLVRISSQMTLVLHELDQIAKENSHTRRHLKISAVYKRVYTMRPLLRLPDTVPLDCCIDQDWLLAVGKEQWPKETNGWGMRGNPAGYDEWREGWNEN